MWVFGTDCQCDVVLQGRNVSPQHCLLAAYEQGFALEDLGSESGTWINNRRLEPRHPEWVKPSDEIRLGGSISLPWPSLDESKGYDRPRSRKPRCAGLSDDFLAACPLD
jgi:pSer/pThr/pTyr-binding forkhead associated (FHA) protein